MVEKKIVISTSISPGSLEQVKGRLQGGETVSVWFRKLIMKELDEGSGSKG